MALFFTAGFLMNKPQHRYRVSTREHDLLLSIGYILIGMSASFFTYHIKNGFPALTGVLIALFLLPRGLFLLANCIGRYLGIAADRLTPEQEHPAIKTYIDDLLKSLGGSIPTVKSHVLKSLYERKDYPAMLGWIKTAMRLELKVGLRIVDKIDDKHAMSIEISRPVPAIGTPEFKNTRVVVNASRDNFESKSFDWIVSGFAHELSHVVLFSIGHNLQENEKAVDLTAMILGFENFTVTVEQPTIKKVALLGYLTIPERDFALSYLRKVRRVRKADTSPTIYQARKLIANIVGTSITTK